MKQIYRLSIVIPAVLALLALTTSLVLAQNPDQGKLAWEEENLCRRCHGDAGEGVWAGPLAGSTRTAQEWITQVRTPRGNMPMFSPEQVSDETIINMHAYISSLPPVESFTRIDPGLPADAHPGQVLLAAQRCAACHSTSGPIGGFVERGEMPTQAAVITQLRTPRNRMPSFSQTQVSDEQAGQIAEFLAIQFTEAQQTAAGEQAPATEPASPTQQQTPASLPQTGQANSAYGFAALLLAGGALLLIGLALRRRLN